MKESGRGDFVSFDSARGRKGLRRERRYILGGEDRRTEELEEVGSGGRVGRAGGREVRVGRVEEKGPPLAKIPSRRSQHETKKGTKRVEKRTYRNCRESSE